MPQRQSGMPIGETSERSGVSAKMIRYYEKIGLIAPAKRTMSNYRFYSEADLHRLVFIRRARDLGFPIQKIAALLDLWGNQRRSSAHVKRLALQQIDDLQLQIAAMQAMVATLEQLAENCHGDARPDCPIIEELAGNPEAKAALLQAAHPAPLRLRRQKRR